MARRSGWAVAVVALVLLAACGNSEGGGDGGGDGDGAAQPGVSDTEIKVGGVAAITNPLGGNYGDAFEGAKAYFDIVNDEGGVFGRQIKMVAERDDNSLASRNASQVRGLVEQDGVFAVIPVATPSFAGGKYLAENDIPTFGWNINPEWSLGPSLFGEKGSYLCFKCAGPYLTFVAKEAGRSKAGILAYTAVQSRNCAEGQKAGYEKYGPDAGVDLVFEDTSLNFGFTPGDIATDLDEMKSKGVDFVSTCVDGAGSGRIAKAIRENQLDIVQYLPNGYDPEVIEEFGSDLDGSYVSAFFYPFEAEDPPEQMQKFLDAMEERDKQPNENLLAGWINADLFVTGLKAAGEDFTREKLVDAINEMTDYTAGGIIPGIDWTIAHEKIDDTDCTATLQFKGAELVPVFGEPGKPFVCFDLNNVDIDNPEVR